jgi:hypothetical protein
VGWRKKLGNGSRLLLGGVLNLFLRSFGGILGERTRDQCQNAEWNGEVMHLISQETWSGTGQ